MNIAVSVRKQMICQVIGNNTGEETLFKEKYCRENIISFLATSL
jgi:hypothetical protein